MTTLKSATLEHSDTCECGNDTFYVLFFDSGGFIDIVCTACKKSYRRLMDE